ncbi:dolichol kinase [Amyelois transitella]|uniref:dolichol kinase n=1 Tax=Amyelois transitella TaxID=680683 RepID=UPI00067CEFBB|nr:dolichol kinase [Amyelois transitella]
MDKRPDLIYSDYLSLSTVFKSKYMKIFMILDEQIKRNLKVEGIITRPVNSNGIWCCALLPAVLSIYALFYEVSLLYKIIACLSIGLLTYSILFMLFLSVSCVVLHDLGYGGCTASTMVSVLMVYYFLGQDLIFSLICSFPSLFLYNLLLRTCLVQHPKTFTVGEAMIVSQGIVLTIVTIGIKLFRDIGDQDEEMEFINTIVNTMLSTVGLIVTALYLLSDDQRNLQNLGKIFTVALAFAMMILHSIIGVGFLPKIIHYIFLNKNRAQIFAFWLSLVVIAILVLMSRTQLAIKANTVTRKSFHVLASLVFMSGIILDVNLIRLASGIGLALVILIEALRKSNIEPISSTLQAAFDVYSDEKDVGSFAMSPLYLFAGLAAPLALVPQRAAPLERLAGVLAIGVGDAAASWLGSNYGFYKWRVDNNRTLEGTAFNILSQIATVYALVLFEFLDARLWWFRATVSAIVSALVEAHTAQVDNLVLPLVALLALQATEPLCRLAPF